MCCRSPLLLYLAGAGIGRIGIVDPDVVDVSNIHRQIIHFEADASSPEGVFKALSAKRAVARINSTVRCTAYTTAFTAENAAVCLACAFSFLPVPSSFAHHAVGLP